MKTICKFILLQLLVVSISHGQNRIQPGIYTIKNKKYEVIRTNVFSEASNEKIIISSVDNKYFHSAPPRPKVQYPFPMQLKDIHVDNDRAKSIILNVLKDKLDMLKSENDTLGIRIVFMENGKIGGITYMLKPSTIITIDNIDQIEKLFKAELKAKFTGIDYLQYKLISYSLPSVIF
ncbi:hypothetical protein [Pedobacter mucosus]|uniref:hypothetical protein n=1 Tax=Pedobacter mucosus TaxID=2895286 RepID=UPI001EE40A4B|nr:hypothetical protein [Pedobacter mucosus]UKT64288.1 hypothetical protein LOK61_00585 [Pedobacter mucosus]